MVDVAVNDSMRFFLEMVGERSLDHVKASDKVHLNLINDVLQKQLSKTFRRTERGRPDFEDWDRAVLLFGNGLYSIASVVSDRTTQLFTEALPHAEKSLRILKSFDDVRRLTIIRLTITHYLKRRNPIERRMSCISIMKDLLNHIDVVDSLAELVKVSSKRDDASEMPDSEELRSSRQVLSLIHQMDSTINKYITAKSGPGTLIDRKVAWSALRVTQWIRAHQRDVLALTVQVNGSFIISCGADCVMKLWSISLEGMKEDFQFHGHHHSVASAVYDDQLDQIFSVSYDGYVRKWSAGTPSPLAARQAHRSSLHCIVLDKEQHVYLTGGAEGAVRAWKADDLHEVGSSEPLRASIECLALYSARRVLFAGGFDGSIVLFQVTVEEGGLKFQRTKRIQGHEQSVNGLVLDLYLKLLCSAGDDTTIKVKATCPQTVPSVSCRGHAEPVRSLVVDETRSRLLSGGAEGNVMVWSLKAAREEEVKGELLLHVSARICCIAGDQYLNRLYIGDRSGGIRMMWM
ncbi:hypothetical protein GUITHDRAFT_105931 [Guillardia theta CCMP2712]|uniref:Uncharacterized protein n=1 Tax=Guillardia theta (strain CCMP2712) TaxID=905079 RepID=L1JJL0_GUITC|nr:hypothetical protein GUITHDRAFT_105931 [Guillardia theta CCMP2712]EKX48324.1 hypothetical protein GUITHDRAFT_105931 [Guillardia theta CCMP2712]|eukprot:XP_005835304.1 hypothetical protein GUITHDRAFT_105931 [Guillardia theta CCMP2712]